MPTDAIVRFEYRDHILDIARCEGAGRWQGDWAVFARESLVAAGAGVLAVPSDTSAAARGAARRGVTAWADACTMESGADTTSSTAATPAERR